MTDPRAEVSKLAVGVPEAYVRAEVSLLGMLVSGTDFQRSAPTSAALIMEVHVESGPWTAPGWPATVPLRIRTTETVTFVGSVVSDVVAVGMATGAITWDWLIELEDEALLGISEDAEYLLFADSASPPQWTVESIVIQLRGDWSVPKAESEPPTPVPLPDTGQRPLPPPRGTRAWRREQQQRKWRAARARTLRSVPMTLTRVRKPGT